MSGRPVSDLLSEYTLVLRGTGLTEVGIAQLHDAPEPGADETIHEILQEHVSGSPEESQLFARLCKTIVDSARGIESPAEYWNSAPAVHLRELLVPYGLEISFEPTRYSDSIADGRFDIHVTDADGTSYRTRFEYPESPLGDDNYPALLHRLEEDILSAAGLTFVRLRSPTEKWRFMMLTTAQLEALQSRYGERIEVLGEPLLAKNQPVDFTEEGSIPVPEWYETEPEPEDTGPDLDELLREGPEPTAGTSEVPTEEDVAAPELEGVESEEEIVQAVQPETVGERTTGPAHPGSQPESVEASDNEVQSVFGDLSDVSLEKATDGGPSTSTPAEGGSVALDSSGGPTAGATATEEDEPMDDLFDEIEREVAGEGRDEGLGGDDDASISDLVGDDTAGAAGNGSSVDGPSTGSATDGPFSDDTTASSRTGGERPGDGTKSASDSSASIGAGGTGVTDRSGSTGGFETLDDRDTGPAHDESPGSPDPDPDTTATDLFDRLDRERRDRS